MADGWVQEFIDGLHRLEETGNPEPLLAQFAPGASAWTPAHAEPLEGHGQVRDFWEQCRGAFERVSSTFERVIEGEGEAALEWRAEGMLRQGGEVACRGVTLLRHGTGGIMRFASYYDPQPFLESMGVLSKPRR